MRSRAVAAVVLGMLGASGAGAQDSGLPPGILLLSKIKRNVQHELSHLPEYTCLETVQRSTSWHPDNKKIPKGELVPLDTLRLEVLYSGKKEWYASPGAGNFSTDSPVTYIDSGMIGDGIFAANLQSVFVSDAALFTWRGEETVARDRGWSHAVRYDFRIPQLRSGWSVTVPGGHGIVGAKGSFWADPETAELLRLEIHADEIPPDLPVFDVIQIASYGRMRIGEDEVMLPQSAEMRMIQSDKLESLDQFEFTHCRSYHAESSISFDTSGAAPKAAAPAAPERTTQTPGTIPAGLTVPVALTTAVGNDSAVGALLEGRVSGNVVLKGQIIIPEGALIHGRIRRLEHREEADGYFVVGLEFTEVDTGNAVFRFYADLEAASGAPGLQWTISNRPAENYRETIRLPDLPGVGSFFIHATKFLLPAGFRMQWKTRSLGK